MRFIVGLAVVVLVFFGLLQILGAVGTPEIAIAFVLAAVVGAVTTRRLGPRRPPPGM